MSGICSITLSMKISSTEASLKGRLPVRSASKGAFLVSVKGIRRVVAQVQNADHSSADGKRDAHQGADLNGCVLCYTEAFIRLDILYSYGVPKARHMTDNGLANMESG